jgi:hypothetical protein
MPRIAAVDDRFQSYNIEMVEVTGGRFWKPYASPAIQTAIREPGTARQIANQPAGMDASLYQYRSPINLSNPRLRKLAAALGPAYLRVSGTWANTTYFQNLDDPAPATPPDGFKGVLTRAQWKGVVDFAHAANAELVTSFAVSMGTRDASGTWTPEQAHNLLSYTRSIGGSIAAAEFMNEPTLAAIGGAPAGYDAPAFARDFAVFRSTMKAESPSTLLLGPGGVMEGAAPLPASMHPVKSDDILASTGPVFDAISYHSYAAVSSRCAAMGGGMSTTPEAALTVEWLARPVKLEFFYATLRDRFEPGKPLWNTETAQAACGGDRWASTFRDSFRYLNQLGALAQRGVAVHLHNTLAASDYGLLDENTYEPRPTYWAALLWRRLMGTIVLNPGPSPSPDLHLYAHCLRGQPGGVALLVINTGPAQTLRVAAPSKRYTLSALTLDANQVQLNGASLALGANDALPEMRAVAASGGELDFAPATITFLELPKAKNPACK